MPTATFRPGSQPSLIAALLLLLAHQSGCSTDEPGLDLRTIDRRKLSFSEFTQQYAKTSRPVVIEQGAKDWPALGWDLERLTSLCGKRPLQQACDDNDNRVMRFNRSAYGEIWAGLSPVDLEQQGLVTVADLIAAMKRGQSLYLHDQCIDVLCPVLLEYLRSPQHFPVHLLQQTPLGWSRNQHSCESDYGHPAQPSLFIGNKGTQSGMHADPEAARFWMAVIKVISPGFAHYSFNHLSYSGG